MAALEGREVIEVRRLGKRIAFRFTEDHWLVIHLMIAGRLHWFAKDTKVSGRAALARLNFDSGTLTLTEAGTKRRAAIYVLAGEQDWSRHDRGGLEVLEAPYEDFRSRLLSENHTLKRSLTDPRMFSGIGNAYSDEILHRAKLSPLAQTRKLSDEQIRSLYDAAREELVEWTELLRKEAGDEFPEGVTAFRKEMAVHGKFGKPCPICGTAVQRIRYAENETNYCPRCQTGGKILADRSLSRLLKDDWPRNIDELERL